MSKDSLVSIITPSYNAAEFIEETVNSVLNQSHKNIEIVIVDDGSTDNTLATLAEYTDKLKVIPSQHKGACAARNKGAAIAKGDYFLFLDADDILESNCIEELLKGMKKGVNISMCQWHWLREIGGEWNKVHNARNFSMAEDDFIRAWLTGWFVPPAGILWDKEFFFEVGGWDESLHANQDGDLMLRALLNNCNISITNMTCVYYRHHNAKRISVSSIKNINTIKSRIKVLEKVSQKLKELDKLEYYKIYIGRLYHNIARNSYRIDKELARKCDFRSIEYAGDMRFTGSKMHVILSKLLGLEYKELLASLLDSLGFSNIKRKKSKSLEHLSKLDVH